jgi:hypothetical protein
MMAAGIARQNLRIMRASRAEHDSLDDRPRDRRMTAPPRRVQISAAGYDVGKTAVVETALVDTP